MFTLYILLCVIVTIANCIFEKELGNAAHCLIICFLFTPIIGIITAIYKHRHHCPFTPTPSAGWWDAAYKRKNGDYINSSTKYKR